MIHQCFYYCHFICDRRKISVFNMFFKRTIHFLNLESLKVVTLPEGRQWVLVELWAGHGFVETGRDGGRPAEYAGRVKL